MPTQQPFNGTLLGYADTINGSAIGQVPLSGIDCSVGVRAGTKCFVAAGLQYWTLTISAAAVDHISVEAALNFPSMRWILDATPGSGTITSIASAAGTITVTNPAGPAVNLEVPMPTGRVAVGIANLLSSTPNLTWNNAAPALKIIGTSTLNVPTFIVDSPSSGGLSRIQKDWQSDGVTVARERLAFLSAVITSFTYSILTSNTADAFVWNDSPGVASGTILPNRRDAGFGAFTALAVGATSGFLFLSSMPGNPTGVPASQASFPAMVAHVYDSTNDRLNFYRAGWRGIAASAPIAAGAGAALFGTAPGGILNLNALWETFRDAAGVLSYRPYFQ